MKLKVMFLILFISFLAIGCGCIGCGSCNGYNIDMDGEGVLNSNDNCPGTSNPDQTDSDNDGSGDSFDYTPFQNCNLESSSGVGGNGETLSDLTVGAGYSPTFSWTGDNVENLTVTSVTNPSETIWSISTIGENGISLPIAYGTVPDNAEEQIKTESVLTIGVTYKISIRRSTGVNLYSTFMPQGETLCPFVSGSGGASEPSSEEYHS